MGSRDLVRISTTILKDQEGLIESMRTEIIYQQTKKTEILISVWFCHYQLNGYHRD